MDGTSKPQKIGLGDTARIDRRDTILAQIEAALLADKLAIEEAAASGGIDPYNTGVHKAVAGAGVWNGKRPR